MYLFKFQREKERERLGREREKEYSICFPDDCNCQGWANLKLGSRNFFQISHLGIWIQGLGLSSAVFHAISRKPDWKYSSWDIYWCPYGMPALQAET